MRLNICSGQGDMLVLAEEFEIEGSDQRFAVHRAVEMDAHFWDEWIVTHVETGFNFACGPTIEDAIEAGRSVWLSKTPEQRAAAVEGAFATRRKIDMAQGKVPQ